MKNLTKLMNCFSNKKTVIYNNAVKEVKSQPNDNPKYRFQYLISTEDSLSDFFKELREEIIESLKRKMCVEEFSFDIVTNQKVFEELVRHKKLIVRLIIEELIEEVSVDQIGIYLKMNNRFSNVQDHIAHIAQSLNDCCNGIFNYLDVYNDLVKKNQFDKLALKKGFLEDLIKLCISMHYFDNGFQCDLQKRFELTTAIKCKYVEGSLNSKSLLKTSKYHICKEKFDKLEAYENSGGLILKDEHLRNLLIKNLSELTPKRKRVNVWDYSFGRYIDNLKNVFSNILKGEYLNCSWKEFLAVIEKGNGQLHWQGDVNSIVQFIGILKRDTNILDNIKSIDSYIRTHFIVDETITSITSALTNKSRLLKGSNSKNKKGSSKDYDRLICMLDLLPKQHVKSD